MALTNSSKSKASGKAGLGCGLLFGIVWTLFSSVFVVVGLMSSWNSVKSKSWDEIPCIIEHFEIQSTAKADPPFSADLRFLYQVDGRDYEGQKLWWDQEGDDDYEPLARARAEVLQGPEGPYERTEGLTSTCRVNPANPEQAALLPSPAKSFWAGLAFAVFGGGFVLVGFGLIRATRKHGAAKKSRSGGASNGGNEMGGLLAAGFFGVFALAGLGIFFGLVVPSGFRYFAAQGWDEVPAEVVWSEVRSKRSDDGTTYRPDVFYRYSVDGRDYHSNQYSIFGGSSSGRGGKATIVRAHPPGHRFTCFADPDDPHQAVIVRSLGWSALFALFPLPFMAIGLGGLWATFVRKKKPASGRNSAFTRSARAARASKLRDDTPASSLRATGSMGSGLGKRILNLVGSLFLAAFWNGIVSVFVWQAWKGWRTDDPEWFLMIFLIPFVLIGAFLLIHVPYRLLAVFSPRYEMKLSEEDLRPGSRTILRWKRVGGRGKPRRFSLYLVGIEEATYRQGTSTSTAKSVFCEELLFETEMGLAMPSGQCEIKLPADTVPTFSGKHNKLRWFIRLIADVPHQPDVKDQHELNIRPLEAHELPS